MIPDPRKYDCAKETQGGFSHPPLGYGRFWHKRRGAFLKFVPPKSKSLDPHAVFRQFFGKNPILSKFWAQGPPWGENSAGPPLTNILDPRLQLPCFHCLWYISVWHVHNCVVKIPITEFMLQPSFRYPASEVDLTQHTPGKHYKSNRTSYQGLNGRNYHAVQTVSSLLSHQENHFHTYSCTTFLLSWAQKKKWSQLWTFPRCVILENGSVEVFRPRCHTACPVKPVCLFSSGLLTVSLLVHLTERRLCVLWRTAFLCWVIELRTCHSLSKLRALQNCQLKLSSSRSREPGWSDLDDEVWATELLWRSESCAKFLGLAFWGQNRCLLYTCLHLGTLRVCVESYSSVPNSFSSSLWDIRERFSNTDSLMPCTWQDHTVEKKRLFVWSPSWSGVFCDITKQDHNALQRNNNQWMSHGEGKCTKNPALEKYQPQCVTLGNRSSHAWPYQVLG